MDSPTETLTHKTNRGEFAGRTDVTVLYDIIGVTAQHPGHSCQKPVTGLARTSRGWFKDVTQEVGNTEATSMSGLHAQTSPGQIPAPLHMSSKNRKHLRISKPVSSSVKWSIYLPLPSGLLNSSSSSFPHTLGTCSCWLPDITPYHRPPPP